MHRINRNIQNHVLNNNTLATFFQPALNTGLSLHENPTRKNICQRIDVFAEPKVPSRRNFIKFFIPLDPQAPPQ